MKLEPEEELNQLKIIYGNDNFKNIYDLLIQSFNVIQARAQILLSLATICLTITGFSGPKIAESSLASKFAIGYGLAFVLSSVVVLLLSPLRIGWVTQFKKSNVEETLVFLIKRRNDKTKMYHLSMLLLSVGLTGYVLSVVFYLLMIQ